MRLIVVAILIFFSQIFSQNPDFSLVITASGGDASYNLEVGFSPNASDGYDDEIDRYAPPAPPAPAFYTALIWDHDSYYTQILNGSVDDLVEHVYDIVIQYDASNLIELSWDNTGWSELGTFILQDAFGGMMIDVDMTTQNSLELTNPALNTLKLKVTPKYSRPDDWNPTPNPSSGTFVGQATIDGVNADDGDWSAALDEDGNIAGAAVLTISGGVAYINMPIYGDDPTTPDFDEGMNSGEDFTLYLWDSSEDAIYEYSSSFDCWYNNNGAPMDGCSGYTIVYDFPSGGGGENFPPVANDQSLFVNEDEPLSLTLTGSDADGDDLTFLVMSGPSHGTLSGDAPDLTYTPHENYHGIDVFTFSVSDGQDSNEGTVSITVNPVNDSPSADFTYTSDNLVVTFSNTSSDVDGDDLSSSWDFGDGNTSMEKNPVHTYAEAGTYSATLTVTDENSLVATYTGEIIVVAPVGPTADFTYTKNYLIVSFADASTAGDSTINTWVWDFGDGNTSMEKNPVHTYAEAGTYSVSLTVTDENDLNDTYTEDDITVEEYTEAGLAASFGYSVNFLEVTFVDISAEGDGDITNWYWNFGDDSTSTEQNPVHTYLKSGNYFVKLVVTDENEMIDERTEFINIATQKLILPINYPNPFKDNTTIIFLSNSSRVTIDIFNLLGQKVHTLISTYVNEEVSRVDWNGKNFRGKLVRAGLYFYHIQTVNEIQTGKMVVLR